MSSLVERQENLPKSGTPAEMPQGIGVIYYVRWPNGPEELTSDSLKQVMQNLREGKWENIFLTSDADFEQNFMQLESGGGLYALQFIQDNTGGIGEEAAWFTTFTPEFLGSNEETDIDCSDGQSVIFREDTTTDKDAVMTAIEYFARTGKLWDGIAWMKVWRELAD